MNTKNKTKSSKEAEEPFPSENTPRPPQVMDPSKKPSDERNTPDKSEKDKKPTR